LSAAGLKLSGKHIFPYRRASMENQIKNPAKTGMRISLIILLLGAAIIILPFIAALDMSGYGYGMIVMGGFIALMGLVSYLLFRKRALVMQKILTGNIIAQWQYDPSTWAEMVNAEVADMGGLKIMGIVVGGLFLIIGAVIAIAGEANGVFLGIMIGLAVLFFCIGFLSYSVHKKRLLKAPPEATIASEGVYYMGTLTDWNGVTSVLDSVGFHPKKVNLLVFNYRHLAGSRVPRMVPSTLCIPVPPGYEPYAAAVVEYFGRPFSKEQYREMQQSEEE